jgi:transposase-like protein
MSGTRKRSRRAGLQRRWSEADARDALAALESSGMSMEAFARSGGFSAQRLRWWRDRLGADARVARQGAASRPGLLPVIVRAGTTPITKAGAVVVILVGGVRIEVAEPHALDPSWLSMVISGLGGAVT